MPTEQEIRDLFTLWNDALATGDPQVVADRYAPHAVLIPTLSNVVRTDRAGIVDYFEHFLANRPTGEILESHVITPGPHAAVDAGTYRFHFARPDAPARTVDARYTFVYERAHHGEGWLIVHHHSSAMPEPAS
ncbi:SgcJ/EcaC family oxidoreductase [Streptomyces sp. 4N509B]|uniref:SgcJ/EcaC family oxidoreductase n=1 Tax=Streptomyces sp. 4N509B TaxID=3457413 RepID=UPI003FD568B6